MRFEQLRYLTFESRKNLDYKKFANCGFYYNDVSHKLRCCWCNADAFVNDSDPIKQHHIQCEFLKAENENVSIGQNPLFVKILQSTNVIKTKTKIGYCDSCFSCLDQTNLVKKYNVCIDRSQSIMRFEQLRLFTFAGWKYEHIIPSSKLASCGYFYSQKKDRVFCIWCRRQIDKWKHNDEPMLYHSEICFFKNNKAGNVRLCEDPTQVAPTQLILDRFGIWRDDATCFPVIFFNYCHVCGSKYNHTKFKKK